MKIFIKDNKSECFIYFLLFTFLIVISFIEKISFSKFCGFIMILIAGLSRFYFFNNKQKEAIVFTKQ